MLRGLSMRAIDPTKLLHPSHLQFAPQTMPPPKHSQYFFRHADLRHLHPVVCIFSGECPTVAGFVAILDLKARGFLAFKTAIVLLRMASNSDAF